MLTTAHTGTPVFDDYAAASWSALLRRAYLLAGNHADAEDLTQQTLIKAHAAWSRVIGAEVPDAYVGRILINTFWSFKRSKSRRFELLVGNDTPEPVSSLIAGPEDRMALWPHVRALPPRQRAVIVLRYYEQLSESEIADVLDCSCGNVKSTAHRALQNLRAAVERVGS